MKALFITTPTPDCMNHVRAWRTFAECEHWIFDAHQGVRNDRQTVTLALLKLILKWQETNHSIVLIISLRIVNQNIKYFR